MLTKEIKMKNIELQYLNALNILLTEGSVREDRTGTGTLGIFGHQMKCSLQDGFPLLTTKKVHFKSIVTELSWFLRGRTDNQYLVERGCTIWNEWATKEQCAKFGREEGDLGPVYGSQWRRFGSSVGFDQIAQLILDIKTNPNSRRMIVTGWHPEDAKKVSLPPCHTMFQIYIQDGKLSLHNYMRSCDIFLGLPFNLASYGLLTILLASSTGHSIGDLVFSFGDLHLYRNHIDQAKEQLSRKPKDLPYLSVGSKFKMNKEDSVTNVINALENLEFDDVTLNGYDPHPAIKAEVSV
jgi:thymidylate synthase